MLKEFREFIARGNVIELAIAVVIGAAFGRVITSLVEGVIMPPIGLLLGNVDFSNLFLDLSGERQLIRKRVLSILRQPPAQQWLSPLATLSQ